MAAADDQAGVATGKSTLVPAAQRRGGGPPLPDGRRAQDYAASLRLAVGQRRRALALDAERPRHRAFAGRRRRDRRLRHAERGQRQRSDRPARPRGTGAGGAPALLRARHDHGAAGADPRPPGRPRSGDQPRARPASPRRAAQGEAALAVAHGRRSARRSRPVWPTRRPRSRACSEACTRRSSVPRSPASRSISSRAAAPRSRRRRSPVPFERTADDALGVISVVGRGALFATIVAGPFVLLAGGLWWLSRRFRRRAERRLLESS